MTFKSLHCKNLIVSLWYLIDEISETLKDKSFYSYIPEFKKW